MNNPASKEMKHVVLAGAIDDLHSIKRSIDRLHEKITGMDGEAPKEKAEVAPKRTDSLSDVLNLKAEEIRSITDDCKKGLAEIDAALF